MIVSAPHVERVGAFEAEHDSILIVDADGVKLSQVPAKRVQSVARRHFQVLKPRDGVDLIQLATHIRPEFTRNPSGRLAIDAIPDVPRGVIRKRSDHCVAL